ncbi:MAG: hypothetical protein R6X31_14590 [Anaerolineae bacterium]
MNDLRVLVLGDGLVLGSGIRDLLSREADLEVIARAHDETGALVEQLDDTDVDVVVLDESACLADPGSWLPVLQRCPELRVVMVCTDSNCVQVLERSKIQIDGAADLVEAVRGVGRRP